MRRILSALAGMTLVSLMWTGAAMAGVGNPQIRTDHPLYPGELAYSTPERFAQAVVNTDWGLGLGTSERDQALKLWLWRITHTIHDYSPRTWTPVHTVNQRLHGTHERRHPTRPDPKVDWHAADDIDHDAWRWQFSYGYALCGTLHRTVGPQIAAIGRELGKDWRSRVVSIPGDANHELYYGGKWRAFDVNALTLFFSTNDAATADLLGFGDILGPKGGPKGLGYVDNAPTFNGKILPKWTWSGVTAETGHLADYDWAMAFLSNPAFYWDGDEVGRHKTRDGSAPLSYNGGYNACPIVYALRPGESFTRWFDGNDAMVELGLAKPIWWGANLPGGPGKLRWWSHYMRDLPAYSSDSYPLVFATDSQWNNTYSKHNRGQATHGNGLYRWQPNLTAADWREGAARITGPVQSRKESPKLTADGPASVTLAFFSPYVIAGVPVDDRDPALSGATYGAILHANAVGDVTAAVSVDNGMTFMRIGTLSEACNRLDFTDRVKGRNQYLLRLTLAKGKGLDSLDLQTVVTTCRAVYPKLKSGQTTVTYEADGLVAFDATPDLARKATATAAACFEKVENLTWTGYENGSLRAWDLPKGAGACVYKVTAPAGRTLATVSAAASVIWPVPSQRGCWAELAVAPSPDGPWRTVGRIDAEAGDQVNTNESSANWVSGTADVTADKVSTAYVRLRLSAADKNGGVRYLRLYGTTPVSNAQPMTVAYHWTSDDKAAAHVETIPAGAASHRYTIQTGSDVKNGKVVFAVPASK